MTVKEVVNGIYAVQFDHVRVFVLEDTPEGEITLIDTAFKENGDELVRKLDAAFPDIDRVVITHGDHGHHGGLDHVMQAFDPKLATPDGETKLYEDIDHEPDIRYVDGQLLTGGLRVIQIPGHTEATSALLLEERGTLISGDTLDGADRAGLPAGYLLPPPALFNEDHEAAEINLYDLLQYEFETLLVFHGSHIFENPRGKLNDFLVEREWDPRP